MTWQDELQHLDAELAAGRISADDYRQRRDAVMGRAQAQGAPSGGFPQQGPGFPQHGPTSGGFPQQGQPPGGFPQRSGQPQPNQNPFPPAFSWGNTAGPQQVQNPNSGGQPVINQPPQAPPSSPQWPSQPGWTNQQQGWSSAGGGTPWDNSDPTQGPEPGDTWMRQGPEVFDTADSKPSGGKLIAGLSIAVVLVVVVGVSVFFWLNSPGKPSQAGPPSTQQQPVQPRPTVPELPAPPPPKTSPASTAEVLVPPPPGPSHPFNGPIDRPSLEGPRSGLLPQAVRDFALQNGLVDAWFHGTDSTTPKTTLIALNMPDENTATGVAKKYIDAQAGLTKVDELSYKGVQVVSTGNGTFRTAYVSHNWVVIVDISAPEEQQQAAKDLFKSTLDAQLTQTPPTVVK